MELHLPEQTGSAGRSDFIGSWHCAGSPFIVMAPGASCDARRYHPDRFAAAAQGIVEKTGLPLLVLGSEREASIIEPVSRLSETNDRIIPWWAALRWVK
jgi:hypothetical protein